ncbi:MAG: hypothetical protein H0T46_15090 [Deltaproteobacteria bacterium]|nr:hypothetical protein [Deltaproteobacteria bacterium]
MTRWFVILVALAACKGEPPEGISKWLTRDMGIQGVGTTMGVSFTLKLEKLLDDSRGITVRAACQVGADRLVDVAQPTVTLQPGRPVVIDVPLFQATMLPATPTSCEYQVSERGLTSSRVLATRCDGNDGPCAPNVISRAGAGPTGVTGGVSNVIAKGKSLQIRYRATAHQDMPRGAHLVRMTSCKGHRNDDSWHELGFLKAGESIALTALTEKIGLPPPGTGCETVLGYSPERLGEITDLATFCHRDAVITPGPCPR